MRKMLITLALVAAPALAAAQTQTPKQTPVAAHDSTKAKPKPKTTHRAAPRKVTGAARDTSKAKPATPAPDSTKKPN